MLPVLGPIIGAAARTIATRVATRAAAGAAARTVAGRAVSASQFTRGASAMSKMGTFGRGAMLMSAFNGSSSGVSSGGSASDYYPTSSEPTKKQGLDTYSDGIY